MQNFNESHFFLSESAGVLSLCAPTGESLHIDCEAYYLRSPKLLYAAIGKKISEMTLWDGTAGLLKDTIALAQKAQSVVAFEKNPLIFAIGQNALERLSHTEKGSALAKKITLYQQDILCALKGAEAKNELPACLYLDPMFTHVSQGLPKKGLQILRTLHNNEQMNDNDALSEVLHYPIRRIVIKRYKKDPYLTEKKPSYSLKEGIIRFDIYLN